MNQEQHEAHILRMSKGAAWELGAGLEWVQDGERDGAWHVTAIYTRHARLNLAQKRLAFVMFPTALFMLWCAVVDWDAAYWVSWGAFMSGAFANILTIRWEPWPKEVIEAHVNTRLRIAGYDVVEEGSVTRITIPPSS